MADRPVVPVVVLATQPGLLMHSALGVVRSLGPLGVPCHLVHRRQRTAVSASRYLAATHRATYDENRPEELVERLQLLGRRLGSSPVLIPVDDPGALFLTAQASALAEAFRFPAQDEKLSLALADKQQLHELAHQHGIPSPRARAVTTVSDAEEFSAAVGFPVVVKAIDPVALYARVTARPPSVAIARSPDELVTAVRGAGGQPVLLQEYVPGGADSVWMFNGYFDAQSECRQAFTGQKIRQFRPETGSTTLGVCRANPVVDELARTFLQQLGYRGIVDMGFRYDARDGQYKLLDVNPRVGATFRLFVGDDGGDVVRTLYADLTGVPTAPSRPREGRRWVVEPHDLFTASHYRRSGHLSFREWVRSYRGVEEAAWFDRTDPKPFLAMLGYTAVTAAERLGLWLRGNRATDGPAERSSSAAVAAYFDTNTDYWDAVYERPDVEGRVYQARQERVLEMLDGLRLPERARVLDVGAGAGLLTAALAGRGLCVTAIDISSAMVAAVHDRVRRMGLSDRVTVTAGDVERLPFPSGRFHLAVALGVVPWLPRGSSGLCELARVVRPGGYVVVSADNRKRLSWRLDPRHAPALRPARRTARRQLVRAGLAAAPASTAEAVLHTPRELEDAVRAAGLRPLAGATVGFGPFTLLGRPALTPAAGLRVDARLQRLADAGRTGVRAWGNHYVLLCQRPG